MCPYQEIRGMCCHIDESFVKVQHGSVISTEDSYDMESKLSL